MRRPPPSRGLLWRMAGVLAFVALLLADLAWAAHKDRAVLRLQHERRHLQAWEQAHPERRF